MSLNNILSGLLGAIIGSVIGGFLTLLAARKQNKANAALQEAHWAREEDTFFKAAVESIGPILNKVTALCARRTEPAQLENMNRELVNQISLADNRCKSREVKSRLLHLQGAVIWANVRNNSGAQALRDWVEATEIYGEINGLVFGRRIGNVENYIKAAEEGRDLPVRE